jgi:hypothetical protein
MLCEFTVIVLSMINNVLILVLMEYALRAQTYIAFKMKGGLNPCFNGICSASRTCYKNGFEAVLILVLMEYALRAY